MPSLLTAFLACHVWHSSSQTCHTMTQSSDAACRDPSNTFKGDVYLPGPAGKQLILA